MPSQQATRGRRRSPETCSRRQHIQHVEGHAALKVPADPLMDIQGVMNFPRAKA